MFMAQARGCQTHTSLGIPKLGTQGVFSTCLWICGWGLCVYRCEHLCVWSLCSKILGQPRRVLWHLSLCPDDVCVTWEEPLRVSGCVSVLVCVAVHLCESVHSVGPSTSPRGVVSPSAWACVSVHPPGSPACVCVDPAPVRSSGCVGTTGGHARCLRVPMPVRISSPPSLWASCSRRLMCVL